jgi:hypothetical protein
MEESTMKLKTSEFTLEGLTEHIQSHFKDESIHSNYWEGKFDLEGLRKLLKDSLVILDQTAYVALQDGLYAINFEVEEIPPAMDSDILLFEVDGFHEVLKTILKDRINQKQSEMITLQLLNTYFVK